ncbi:WD40/YVTN/BNR-like repeat-containing protein [Ferrimonas sp.]|uniref:WD40/YVTN/BNR-like repeat-containing protein n=1 Tax=Ferrimonas sp. TaxID=2080861 RepID=UPI003A9535EF
MDTIMRLLMLIPLALMGGHAMAEPPAPTSQAAIQAPKAQTSPMMSLSPAGNSLVAVGSRGQILFKTSGNEGWQQAKAPVSTLLTRVFMLNDQLGWAVGHDAAILHTVDGGQSWSLQQWRPDLEVPLLDIHFQNEREGVTVGAYGQLFRTRDGGKSWQFEYLDSLLIEDDRLYLEEIRADSEEDYLAERAAMLPHINRILPLPGGDLFAVGEMGLMARSSDYGRTWQRLPEIYFGSLSDMAMDADGRWVAVGLRGNAFESRDQGENWTPLDMGTKGTFNSIRRLSDGTLVMVANGGDLAYRKPGESDFTLVRVAKGQDLVDLVENGEGNLWLAGSHGVQPFTIEK